MAAYFYTITNIMGCTKNTIRDIKNRKSYKNIR